MDAISGVSAVGSSPGTAYARPAGGVAESAAAAGIAQAAASQSLVSINSLSIAASSETFLSTATNSAGNKELMNALLLLLTLEYLKSDNEEERKGLLALITALAQSGQGGESQTLFYSSSSLNIESTQIQIVSSQAGIGAYGGAAGAGVPGIDADSNTLDITI